MVLIVLINGHKHTARILINNSKVYHLGTSLKGLDNRYMCTCGSHRGSEKIYSCLSVRHGSYMYMYVLQLTSS